MILNSAPTEAKLIHPCWL